ncbi:MAG: hypothetical protein Ct9H90mP20_1890 [Candidatus Neomarinimicrobiota bacterium]|nr:MAG: hypothetical protein Ct9H90mP20_1890 [Candidatus Neomarinimicrobiota bacterium]
MGLLENKFQDNVVVASLDKILGWARSTSPGISNLDWLVVQLK